ncbi:nucleotidyltransferase family protein [Flavisolibacter nicotianae]|uniref:nucleotidyltransferase family protein n=1 Tax=Flavisolibacter nicotianae TaxID=2364882 RepID=UPI000EB0A03D|nr:nucleotidyltransferase family protein [Flavisolibacter nicotianae]
MKENKERIREITIAPQTSILTALKKMDELQAKLLLVMDDKQFVGLLSIGDIQRGIIKNVSVDAPIGNIIRQNGILVAKPDEDFEIIKNRMLQYRTECMPVVSEGATLERVYFWEEVFGYDKKIPSADLGLPVVIMAGGKGSRLKPITNVLPKPLIPVGDKTILEHILDRFVAVNCHSFVMTVNYKAEMIRHYFDTLNNSQYQLEYIHEENFLGTAGSLYLLKGKITKPFFVSNCDIIIDCDYSEIYKYHQENKNEITIVGVLKHYPIPYGVLETKEGGMLQSIQEKPEYTFKINSGMYILEAHLLDEIPENQHFHITELIEKVRLRNGRIGVFPVSEGAWMDIGEWSEYNKTVQKLGFKDIVSIR